MTPKHKDLKKAIKDLLSLGVYDHNELFNRIYPTFRGHYSTLRNTIAEVKNGY